MEQADSQNHPDKYIGDDAARQVMAMHGNSTIPEQRCQSPSQWTRDGREMHEYGETGMAPVSRKLVEEVGD